MNSFYKSSYTIVGALLISSLLILSCSTDTNSSLNQKEKQNKLQMHHHTTTCVKWVSMYRDYLRPERTNRPGL